MTLDLVEGWTAPVPLTLEADGAALDLTGLTVTAQVYDKDGTAVDASGDVAVTGAAAGEIEWTPDASDLSADLSPYELRFKLSGSDGDAFNPNAKPVQVIVRR